MAVALSAFTLPVRVLADAVVPAAVAGEAWSLRNAVYSGKSADIARNTTNARSIEFHPDGTRMYVVGRGSQNVAEYRLPEPWDVSGATFVRELRLAAPEAHGIFFNKANGTDLYVFNRTEILQFSLATPWDVTTARPVATRVLACHNARLVRGHDIHFKPDGTRFYVEDRMNQAVYEYALSEPWSVATLRWRHTLDISDRQKEVRGIELDPTGTRMWLMDTGRNEIMEYHLGTPWELRSARFNQALNVDKVSLNTRGITWRPDGRAFYITSTGRQRIYQFVIP